VWSGRRHSLADPTLPPPPGLGDEEDDGEEGGLGEFALYGKGLGEGLLDSLEASRKEVSRLMDQVGQKLEPQGTRGLIHWGSQDLSL
jgi:hypothetical protein